MNGTSVAESFSVTSLDAAASTVTALPGLAGRTRLPAASIGVPFFYNRRVATAIEGYTTSRNGTVRRVLTGPVRAFEPIVLPLVERAVGSSSADTDGTNANRLRSSRVHIPAGAAVTRSLHR